MTGRTMTGRTLITTAAGAVMAVGLATAALAQTPAKPQPADPNMPSTQNTVPEKIEPNSTGATGTLSEKLNKSDGVIKPRSDVDPGMAATAPAPHGGTMPVIPPPGSPGGNPNIQPK